MDSPVRSPVRSPVSSPIRGLGTGVPPVLTGLIFTAGGSGVHDSLELAYNTSSGHRVYIATGGNSLSVTAAQLLAGSGGTDVDEFANYALGTEIDITGLTSASEASTRIAAALIRPTGDPLASNVRTVTVSGLDFTAITMSSATTNSAGTLVTLTMSEAAFGTENTANWSVERNGTPQTPSAVDITGSTISLTVAGLQTGETITVNYSGGDLEDGKGNPLAAITDGAVTNAVSTVGFGPAAVFTQTTTIDGNTGTTFQTIAAAFDSAGSWLVHLASIHENPANSLFALSGPNVTSATLLTDTTGVKTGRVSTSVYWVVTSGASDLTITETANISSYGRRIVVQKANGLTNTGAIVGNATSASTSFSVALASVPSGHYVSAMFANRLAAMTGVAFAGSFVAGDEVHDLTAVVGADNFTSAAASADATSTGTFTCTINLTASSSHSVMSAVALAPI